MATPDSKPHSRRFFNQLLLAGTVGASSLSRTTCHAQVENSPVQLSSTATTQYGRMARLVKDISGFLQAIEFERTAILGSNYFAVSVCGIDAIKDLEEGRGVDPETLAGLYCGFAIPAVAEHLNTKPIPGGGSKILSPDGRLRYKGTVVRLYSPDQLRELFQRREGFRNENDRIKRHFFADYVYSRKRDTGKLERVGEESEITELLNWYERFQAVSVELDNVLRAERTVNTVLQGDSVQHAFSLSIGGIDVSEDLRSRGAIDPETLAGIYAERVSTDYSTSFQVAGNGAILYDGIPIKLYSQKQLAWCFKMRERLELQASVR